MKTIKITRHQVKDNISKVISYYKHIHTYDNGVYQGYKVVHLKDKLDAKKKNAKTIH